MSEMEERVALAISGGDKPTDILSIHRARARLAIEAMREPTQKMIEFGDAVRGNHADYAGGNGTANIFRAMIDEALK